MHSPHKLRAFFTYYGTKFGAVKKYPNPSCSTIIEPFAGAAGYSLYHFNKNVILNDLDPTIFGVWSYLIKTKPEEILKLPIVETIDDLHCCQEAKWLISYNFCSSVESPRKRLSGWAKKSPKRFWGPVLRKQIAVQCQFIKHWKILNKSYEDLDNQEATWFIDPPYNNKAGEAYTHNCEGINFTQLAKWCTSREGQYIVCENLGADWLPFKSLCKIKSTHGYSEEVIYTNFTSNLEKLFN